ncbi:ATP-binding cassette domain-containing protein [Arthrobacter sp. SA17]
MSKAIEVDSLSKSFGHREVLHNLEFSVEAGTVYGMIGPNGAGKTTTMRCLLDIIRPTGGHSASWARIRGKLVRNSGAGSATCPVNFSSRPESAVESFCPTTRPSADQSGRDA